jgi:hypothetical protein
LSRAFSASSSLRRLASETFIPLNSATQLFQGHAALGFLQKSNDLLFRIALLHVQSPLWEYWTLNLCATQIWGDIGPQVMLREYPTFEPGGFQGGRREVDIENPSAPKHKTPSRVSAWGLCI